MSVEINKENFQTLLKWLDADIERASEKYGHIHRALIKIFRSSGCPNPEELADETIDRVAAKVDSLQENFTGEKIRYFLGVARNIKKESYRRAEKIAEIDDALLKTEPFVDSNDADQPGIQLICLQNCLKKMNSGDRKLILDYHNVNQTAKKSDIHKKLAKKNSLTMNALRVQIFRLKQKLSVCAAKCVEKGENL